MTAERADWRDDAACRSIDPDLFFPISATGPALGQIDKAKRVCFACPVRVSCLEWALGQGVLAGVWGGTTEDERRTIPWAPRGRQRQGMSEVPSA